MTSPVGLHRVLEPAGVLPQAATRLDNAAALGADEVRIRVERINLDAASFRELSGRHGGDGDRVRAEVLGIIERRGKMQNPVTGSGGMLIGTVEEVGPRSPLAVRPGDRVATLVSLTLTPLAVSDGLARWDGRGEQVPCDGHAILFARSIVAVLPVDLDARLSLAVLDVCGAPALTARVVGRYAAAAAGGGAAAASSVGAAGDRAAAGDRVVGGGAPGAGPTVAVIGGAGKSGCLALAAARRAGAARTVGVVPVAAERNRLADAGLADVVALADARDAVALSTAVTGALGGPADVTVVCVDVPGCEHGAILATADGGTVIFFSMATSFAAAALGAEGLAADVTMLIGNGYVPGHAELALALVREVTGVRALFEARLSAD
ncbi:zinc-binding alcohol dehydrogenase [Solwaraspora sp. WMMD1047]|uniref:L-erythro-3,5-diaminohexanoate dehydrogenase n=1 Tax=Solwaraspora sp. WMMD1047 TaxID=3016102 RepID=UPI002415E916|nr:zinc-binding alcohol dehydrogenase [Solwaraspora sp. WMMD1047]MDG4831095.1 zinc-binding alcohol dehydrogenase [Solwaraspora sp. WMMD1047]